MAEAGEIFETVLHALLQLNLANSATPETTLPRCFMMHSLGTTNDSDRR